MFRALSLAAFIGVFTAYVSSAASPIKQLTNTTASNVRPAFSPDGKRIAFQSNRDGPYHIFVMDADGSNVSQLTNGDLDDRHPAWSPDGKTLVIDSGDSVKREIWTIDLSSKRRTQITKLGAIASFPSFSPDGKRIGFFVYQAGTMDLWTADAGSATPTRLTRDLASEANSQCTFACHSAAWSPDGSRLAVTDGDGARVLLLSSSSGQVAAPPISPDDEKSHFPTYLPDGRIVYVTEHVTIDQSWTDLWLVDPRSNEPRTELATQVQAQGPFEFSGDARQLLFSSPRSGNFEIYSVTLDAAGKAALATRPTQLSSQDVQPPPSQSVSSGFSLPKDPEPYFLALAVIAFGTVGVEAFMRRRRSRPKT